MPAGWLDITLCVNAARGQIRIWTEVFRASSVRVDSGDRFVVVRDNGQGRIALQC